MTASMKSTVYHFLLRRKYRGREKQRITCNGGYPEFNRRQICLGIQYMHLIKKNTKYGNDPLPTWNLASRNKKFVNLKKDKIIGIYEQIWKKGF